MTSRCAKMYLPDDPQGVRVGGSSGMVFKSETRRGTMRQNGYEEAISKSLGGGGGGGEGCSAVWYG
jgi:hypothetical protein